MTPSALPIRVQDIDHCGIVAGIIDAIGLVGHALQKRGFAKPEVDELSGIANAMPSL
jgi:hypothetical protein